MIDPNMMLAQTERDEQYIATLRDKLAEAEALLRECLAVDNLPVEAECGLPCELAASITAYLAGVQHE